MNWLKEKKLKLLLYACIVSLAGLVILFGIRIYAPTLLDIDIKWLVVAAIPIILALIVGRYITRFKMMGFDVELATEGRIIDHEEVFQILHPFVAQRKGELGVLDAMTAAEKARPNVLAFEIGKVGYYEEGAIKRYVQEMRNIYFFLIYDKTGKFVAMINIYRPLFENQGFEKVYRFISDLEQGIVPEDFGLIIRKRISAQARIVDAYKRLRSEYPAVFIVFGDENTELPIGYITREMAERYLASLVLRMADKKQTADLE